MNLLRTAKALSSGISSVRIFSSPLLLQSSPIFHTDGFHLLKSRIHQTALSRSADPSDSESDWNEQRTPPSDRVVKLVDEISNLTLLEVSDLTSLLKKKLGLPEMPTMGMPMMGMPTMPLPGAPGSPSGTPAPAEEAKPEKTIFDIKLEKFDAAAKLKVIKEVRAITGLGLKESKELVEQTPAVIKKGVTKEEGDSILEKLKAVTAVCAME